MKRTDSSKLWSYLCGRLSVLILAGGLLVACDKEETGGVTPLPDGKYPLQLTAKVAQPQTRAGGKDSWTGGEEIGVMLEGMLDPKKYVMDASGKAEPADAENTIYWQDPTKTRVTAWTPNVSNVDISSQRDGYADFDLLYASALGRYKQTVTLNFNHRMAKIEVTLAAGEGITEEEITGATVTFFGDSETDFSGGMVEPADQSDGEIAPYHDVTTKKYEAVMVPQNMKGKPLVRVDIGGKTFAYTPETDVAGNLEANKRYAYAITVKANGIDVQTVTGDTWSEGDKEDVVSLMNTYTADELKIGDFLYSDGTYSDGGLRKLYTDDSSEWDESIKPIDGKTCIGIVFHAGQHEHDDSDYSTTGIGQKKCRGYAVALQDATTTNIYCMWGVYNKELGLYPTYPGSNKRPNNIDYPDYDWSGYTNTRKIVNAAGGEQNLNKDTEAGYPAIWYAVVDYESKHPAPAKSSGWFLPSIGQMYRLYTQRKVLEKISVYDSLHGQYWSSSEEYGAPNYEALYVSFTYTIWTIDGGEKGSNDCYVRSILAF